MEVFGQGALPTGLAYCDTVCTDGVLYMRISRIQEGRPYERGGCTEN